MGGPEKLGENLVSRKRRDEPLPTFVAPEVCFLLPGLSLQAVLHVGATSEMIAGMLST